MLKVKCRIWVHTWRLYERLELVAGMGWGSFNTENALDRLFTQNRISESVGNVGELLVVAPVNLVLVTSIMVVVSGGGPVLEHLLVVKFLGLREPGACGFSPSVVVFEETVV